MEPQIQKTGIIYCRVSSAEQVDGTSLNMQKEACLEHCRRNNINPKKIFIEEGESAKTANRTEFLKAIEYCKDNKDKIDVFIVWKLDRFARNVSDHFAVRANLKKYGTLLESVTEHIGLDPQGELLETILAGFAQFDNSLRTLRSKNGMLERMRQGVWVWRAPLGYKRTGGKGANLIIDEDAAPFIKTIFEEYSKGTYTFETLANFLNKKGYRTSKNKKPYEQVIEKIVKNSVYCGIIRVWGEECKGTFEPIINEELFNKCQDIKAGRAKNAPRTNKNTNFPLRRLIICEKCLNPLTGSLSTGRSGKRYPYYHHQSQGCPSAKFISRDDFEKEFVSFLNKVTPDEKYEKAFKAIVIDIWQTKYKILDQDNARIRKEISNLETERQRIFDLHRQGVYTDNDFIQQKDRVNKLIGQKHTFLQDKRTVEFKIEEALDYCFNFVRYTAKKWIEFGYTNKVRFQKMIFDGNVPFDGNKFGTAELSCVYKMNKAYKKNESNLVSHLGLEPQGAIPRKVIFSNFIELKRPFSSDLFFIKNDKSDINFLFLYFL